MFTLQSSVQESMGECLAGMVKCALNKEDRSSAVEYGNIPFGAAVVQGSVDKSIRLPDSEDVLGFGASGLLFRGIARRSQSVPNRATPLELPEGDGDTAYYVAQGCLVDVITAGETKVEVDSDVVAGQPVFFRHALSANGTKLGVYRSDDDGGTCQRIPNAQFTQTQTAGNNAWLELNTARFEEV